MTKLDNVERSIVAIVNAIADRALQEAWGSDRDWTKAVLLDLARLGHESGFHVCGHGRREYGQGEWLYDLVWLQNEGDYIRDVPLVLECEWSEKFADILENFIKLLPPRAQRRVMIFQQKTGRSVGETVKALIAHAQNFQLTQKGDRYLFLGFDWAEGKCFNAEVFVA